MVQSSHESKQKQEWEVSFSQSEYLTRLLLIWLVLDGINTQAAEQLFSWVKNYANILSSLGWRRMPIYLLLLFHYKNLERVSIRLTHIFNIVSCVWNSSLLVDSFQVSSVPIVHTISLAHMADAQQVLLYKVTKCIWKNYIILVLNFRKLAKKNEKKKKLISQLQLKTPQKWHR